MGDTSFFKEDEPLSLGHENRLVGRRASHGADTVVSSGQTTSDRGFKTSVSISGIIDTLEEGKLGSVQCFGGSKSVSEILDSDVRVTNDNALAIELLGIGVVGAVRVAEDTQLHVGDLHSHIEVRVGSRLFAWKRASDDGGGHLGHGGHVTHHNAVAGAPGLLNTVGQRLAVTEVDEVGIVRERLCLTISSALRAILLRASLDVLCVEREAGGIATGGSGVGIAAVVVVVVGRSGVGSGVGIAAVGSILVAVVGSILVAALTETTETVLPRLQGVPGGLVGVVSAS